MIPNEERRAIPNEEARPIANMEARPVPNEGIGHFYTRSWGDVQWEDEKAEFVKGKVRSLYL